uniref:Retrotransposon gag domain-containing protein n=1 Tax=Nicotiana tabacum TaxID=4097 RepID=A0A1S3YJH5_TOBAC|nr:PREDICTED: uncharacterized protein LOC107776833 [Nicotiana tabacum]
MMEEMKNENKTLRDQMREHKEMVDKIPGALTLFSKRDVGRFVEQSYSDNAAPHAILKTFKMSPYLKIYDGIADPEDHVTHYATAVKGNDLAKEQISSILLKKFGETLTGGALTWYSQLPACSIETFEEMADKRNGSSRFSKWAEQKWSERDKKIIKSAREIPPTTWDEIHNAYYAEVRADEDDLNGPTHQLTSVQAESRKDRRSDMRRDPSTSWPNWERHLPYVRTTAISSPRHEEVPPRSRTGTHLNEREIIYVLEKLGPNIRWPQKMRLDPNPRKSDALYEFHQERGHKIEDCIALRQEVVNMLRQGHLKELLSDRGRTNFAMGRDQHQGPPKLPSPARTIHIIIGG